MVETSKNSGGKLARNSLSKVESFGLKVHRSHEFVKRPRYTAEQCVAGIRAGNLTMLSRAVSWLESKRPQDQQLAQQIVRECRAVTNSHIPRLGFAGSTCRGKRSLVESLGLHLIQEHQKKVALFTMGSSLHSTGGSVLGEKPLMQKLAQNEHCFVRAMATGQFFCETALCLRDAMVLCEAAGYDLILIVGDGGDAFYSALREVADCMIYVALAGIDTEMLGVTSGGEQLADIMVVMATHGELCDEVVIAQRILQNAMAIFPRKHYGWAPRVISYGLGEMEGSRELWQMIERFQGSLVASGGWDMQRQDQTRYWMRRAIGRKLEERFFQHEGVLAVYANHEKQLLAGSIELTEAINRVIDNSDITY